MTACSASPTAKAHETTRPRGLVFLHEGETACPLPDATTSPAGTRPPPSRAFRTPRGAGPPNRSGAQRRSRPPISGPASASRPPTRGTPTMPRIHASTADEPLVLLVPGLGDSGPHHWQSYWERELPAAARVELGRWDDPHRNTWVNQLNLAIHKAGRPVILVAHSLACHVVAWWTEYERPAADGPVRGALLV